MKTLTFVRAFPPLLVAVAVSCFVLGSLSPSVHAAAARPPEARYETRKASRDGIGKFYFGREIAHVMGHEGADWLERPQREAEERPDVLVDALALMPGEAVADIGAGTGYFTWRMARRVGKNGRVYAVEIQQEMLDLLMANMKKRGVDDVVTPVLGAVDTPKLPPGSVDTILLVDVYHEFDHPFEMTEAMINALRSGGRLVFVEYRGEDPSVPIKPLHKMTIDQVRKEMSVHPVKFERTLTMLPQQHVIIFRKK
jgi:precorrin-6B methylase 2